MKFIKETIKEFAELFDEHPGAAIILIAGAVYACSLLDVMISALAS